MKIGEKIRYLRKQNKMSADELAKILNKDRATIYRYENGDIESLPVNILEPLAKALHVTPADILMTTKEDLESKLSTNESVVHKGIANLMKRKDDPQRDKKLEIIKDIVQQDFSDDQLNAISTIIKTMK